MTIKPITLSIFCVFVATSIAAFSQGKAQPSTTETCRASVVDFYSWYGGKALKNNRLTDPEVAVKEKPNLFGEDLRRELVAGFQAQDKAGNDLVSLDGDPFTGPDGPADRYIVKQVKINNGKCWAEAYLTRNASFIRPMTKARNAVETCLAVTVRGIPMSSITKVALDLL